MTDTTAPRSFVDTAIARLISLAIAVLITEGQHATGIAPRSAVAAGLYLLGCIGVTMACNVPLNERLADVDADDSSAHALWQHYLRRWTLWNHVRTIAPAIAALLFLLA